MGCGLKNSIARPLGKKQRSRMLYKRRSRNRDTFTIIRDCQERTFSTPTADYNSYLRIAASCTGTLFVLRGSAPRQMLPQSARRENDGEERGNAEREKCPDKEEGSAGLGDRSADSRPLHVDDRDEQPKERPEEDDDVPRSLSGQHQRSIQPDGQNRQRNEA